ncbi:MAG: hypothetical protein KAJ19_30130 [Gammaproteobacteria bacterium]|nr:hypothetical protein [Gammaproteobacteria bacterium]
MEYRRFEAFGGVKEFVNYRGAETIVHGPAETGKTIGALYKLHTCAAKYPGASIVICRKTLTSTYGSVVVMFQKKVLGENSPVQVYGGEKPQWFDYPNGSRIWITGMDKSSRVLSSEHDLIFVNQAGELALGEWETLTTRTTGRAGNMPYSQTIGDVNPAWPTHWIYNRSSLRLFHSRHSENPALFDQETGEITAQGQRTMAVLEALTGLRRTRLLEGKAARAEGVVYEAWDEGIHLIYADAVPELRRYVAGQDWGYTHPGVLGVWGLDNDGRMYLVAQVYRTKKTIDWWIEQARALDEEFSIEAFVCDPSEPAYIEQYQQAGLSAVAGFNRVRPGINAVQERLAVAGDGKPRLFIVRDSLRQPDALLQSEKHPYAVEQEFPGYVWANKKAMEQPVKEYDDGLDMVRYTVAYVDSGAGQVFPFGYA